MLKVSIPPNFINERVYTLDVLLKSLLKIEYSVEIKKQSFYKFCFNENKSIIIEDHFFSLFNFDESYLKQSSIPKRVAFSKNPFMKEIDIPILFGNDSIKIDKNKRSIRCSNDIIAGIFFMISRWEEYVLNDRDEHNRFPTTASLAYKFNFYDRPVVNEYMVFLINMFKYLGVKLTYSIEPFHFNITHDVDSLLKWVSWNSVIRHSAGDLLKRRKIKSSFSNLYEYLKIQLGLINDPNDNYDLLMDISEDIGQKCSFYFMAAEFSNSYNDKHSPYSVRKRKFNKIYRKIKSRGHIVGFHPGYNTYNNEKIWESQKKLLEKNTNEIITVGRQHYLRFKVPDTWRIWDNQGMTLDSTCGYTDKAGFRCGTGNTFPTFDILKGKTLSVAEQPLILMDSIANIINKDNRDLLNMDKIVKNAKKFYTPVTLLFHPNHISIPYFSNLLYRILDL